MSFYNLGNEGSEILRVAQQGESGIQMEIKPWDGACMAPTTGVWSPSLSIWKPLQWKDQGPLFAAQRPLRHLLCLTKIGSQVVGYHSQETAIPAVCAACAACAVCAACAACVHQDAREMCGEPASRATLITGSVTSSAPGWTNLDIPSTCLRAVQSSERA